MVSIRNILICFVVALSCSDGAVSSAQEVVGQSIVDGQIVQLFSDGTWSVKGGRPETGCRQVARNIEFCEAGGSWKRAQAHAPDVSAMYALNDRTYGFFIVEQLGTKDGFNLELLRKVILENAANGSGVDVSEVPVLDLFNSDVSNKPLETMVYSANMNGVPVIFVNSVYLSKDLTAQITTFSIKEEYSEEEKDVHSDFLSHVKISD